MTSLLKQVQESPEQALWQQLHQVTAVMLGVEGSDTFMSPMAPMPDEEGKIIWFFTSKDNKHYGSVQDGAKAQICLADERDHFWGCINGWIEKQTNSDIIERFWSAKVEAWYQHGIKDKNVLLLAFHPQAAEVSCTTKNLIRFNWEIAKANLKHEELPDISTQTRIRLIK